MNTLEGLPILTHYQNLLTKGKEKDAQAILHEFFTFFDKDSPREYLWYMLVQVLENKNEMITARHRADMIFFYEYCIALFKAAQTLCSQPGKSKKK